MSSPGAYVDGKILTDSWRFEQAGLVRLYNTTNGFLPQEVNTTLGGDRKYGRYGIKVRVGANLRENFLCSLLQVLYIMT